MRTKIAAANWKMNLTYSEGKNLLEQILNKNIALGNNQKAIFATPFPYLPMAQNALQGKQNYFVSAQNCYHLKSGAYTGETSAEMLSSMNIPYCVVGHSERREYFNETNKMLQEKVDLCLANNIIPIFCCGESLIIRESGKQNEFVATQLQESIFHLEPTVIKTLVVAYEPIWAIGTGKTASTEQAQEMHKHLRQTIAAKYDDNIANEISILYGGSVKGTNAKELFSCPDVDGGLVGGASLKADEFGEIIKAIC